MTNGSWFVQDFALQVPPSGNLLNPACLLAGILVTEGYRGLDLAELAQRPWDKEAKQGRDK